MDVRTKNPRVGGSSPPPGIVSAPVVHGFQRGSFFVIELLN